MREVPAKLALRALGLALGGFTAILGAAALAACGLALAVTLPWPRARRRLAAGPRLLAELDLRRVSACYGPLELDGFGSRRAVLYLLLRTPLGLLGAAVPGLLALGAFTAGRVLLDWMRGRHPDGVEPAPFNVVYFTLIGLLLLYLCLQGIWGAAALEVSAARMALGPSRADRLAGRVAELSSSRAGIVAAVDAERRRIERDLHDGLQQRVVALGLLLGRARRAGDPDDAAELVGQAHADARQLLDELREVAWRVYPAALDSLGLADALAAAAERSATPVELRCRLDARPPQAVETAVYFAVSEAIANADKHSGASKVTVDVRREGEAVVVEVRDDGVGGARSDGGGLSGLARRTAALDGSFHVDSPLGGPTEVRVLLPCE